MFGYEEVERYSNIMDFLQEIDEEHEYHVFSPINPFYFLFFYSISTRVAFFFIF